MLQNKAKKVTRNVIPVDSPFTFWYFSQMGDTHVDSFPDDILAELEGLSITEDRFAARPEARGFTVDGPASKDLDDAIWLEQTGEGYTAHVSIADVSAVVRPGSKLHAEALRRAATQYRSNGNVPMLPARLSEDLLSLLPHSARPTVTFSVRLSDKLEPTGLAFQRTVLRSSRRMTYAAIDAIIDGENSDPDREQFRSCFALAQHLMDRRRTKGALAIYDLTNRVYTTEEGFLVPLDDEYAHKGNIIVQEFMILCNSAVAHFMAAQEIPFLYRNHTVRAAAPLREEIIGQLNTALLHPRLLEVVRQRTALWFNKATYGPVLAGHFALSEVAYTHVTSPLRRAADLINHQIIGAYLDPEKPDLPHGHGDLESLASGINKRLADRQEASRKYHKARSLAETREQASKADLYRLSGMTPQQFQQVLKQAATMPAPPDGIARAIAHAIDRHALGAEHLYVLLAGQHREDSPWRPVYEQCLHYLDDHPEYATSVLHMHERDGRLRGVRIENMENGGGFACRVVAVENGTEMSTPTFAPASSKRDAQHKACMAFLRLYWAGKLVDARETRHEDAAPPMAPATVQQEQNFVGMLEELRVKHPGWPAPMYTFKQSGPPHQPVIRCACVMLVGERTLEAAAEDSNKKAAKQGAAEHMLEALTALPAARQGPALDTLAGQPAPAVVFEEPETGQNFVGLLGEFCAAHHISPLPIYGFQLTGPSHQPVVTCTAALTIDGQATEAAGVAFTKKAAKQVAACKLLRMLEAAPPPAGSASATAQENFVGLLMEMARDHEDWSEPLFDTSASGPSSQPLFISTCSMTIENKHLTASGTGWQKNAARHAAAQAMIETVLQSIRGSEAESSAVETDHVAQLTDLCIERSLPLPRITIEEQASAGETAYTCTASIRAGDQVSRTTGVGPTKGIALDAACRELLDIIVRS